jgi:hypothetical protein
MTLPSSRYIGCPSWPNLLILLRCISSKKPQFYVVNHVRLWFRTKCTSYHQVHLQFQLNHCFEQLQGILHSSFIKLYRNVCLLSPN